MAQGHLRLDELAREAEELLLVRRAMQGIVVALKRLSQPAPWRWGGCPATRFP